MGPLFTEGEHLALLHPGVTLRDAMHRACRALASVHNTGRGIR